MIEHKVVTFRCPLNATDGLKKVIDDNSVDGWYCHQVVATYYFNSQVLECAVIIFHKNTVDNS